MKMSIDRAVALMSLCFLASGCSNMSDDTVKVLTSDPAKYQFFDCAQLEKERASLTAQAEELRVRMEKSETGFAGSVVNEAVYQPDNMRLRALLARVKDAWQAQKCAAPASPKAGPSAKQTGGVY